MLTNTTLQRPPFYTTPFLSSTSPHYCGSGLLLSQDHLILPDQAADTAIHPPAFHPYQITTESSSYRAKHSRSFLSRGIFEGHLYRLSPSLCVFGHEQVCSSSFGTSPSRPSSFFYATHSLSNLPFLTSSTSTKKHSAGSDRSTIIIIIITKLH